MPIDSTQTTALIASPALLVPEDYQQILNQLYTGLIQTELWGKVRGSCFCAAGFVSLALTDLGNRTRVLPCYAIALKNGGVLALGNKDSHVGNGMVDGHVVCLINETIIVDFGLSNIRLDDYFSDFPIAVAYKVTGDVYFPCEIVLDEDKRIIWAAGWANPRTNKVMAENRPAYELLYKQYKAITQTFPNQPSPSPHN